MKTKIFSLAGLLVSFITPLVLVAPLPAAGGGPQFEFSPSASSAVANGTSKITFNIFSYYYTCDSGYANDGVTCKDGSAPYKKAGGIDYEYSVSVSGSGNSLGGTYTGPNGAPNFKIGGDGKASFTLASTVAEAKTVKFYFTELNDPNHSSNPTTSVTFTAPPVQAPPKPAPASTPPPTPEPAAPATPTTSSLVVDGQQVSDANAIVVAQEKPLVLGGKTVPNGVVKLFIFSDPKEATVTADAEGNWKYEVSGLEPGSHHVEAEVTDPATNKTSSRATLVAFEVTAPTPPPQTAQTTPKKNTLLWWFIGGGIVLLAAASGGVWFWLRKKKSAASAASNETPPTTPPSDESSNPPSDQSPPTLGQ